MNTHLEKPNMALLWGCFTPLLTTGSERFSRLTACQSSEDFGFDQVTSLQAAGI